jgi:hypothetical protein
MKQGSTWRQARAWRRAWGSLAVAAVVVLGAPAASSQGAGGSGGTADTPPAAGASSMGGASSAGSSSGSSLPVVEKLDATDVARGSPVTARGKNFPTNTDSITLELSGLDIGHPSFVDEKGTSFTFVVPHEILRDGKPERLPLGEHLLRMTITPPSSPAADALEAVRVQRMTARPFFEGTLHVVGDSRAAIKLTKLEPAVISPETRRVSLIGEGMGGEGRDYSFLIDGKALSLCWTSDCAGLRGRFLSPYELEISGDFANIISGHEGKHQVSLRRGERASEGKVDVQVVAHSASTIRHYALALSVAILGLILLLAAKGGQTHMVRGRAYELRSFLIDTETDTYSLSKFQFYLWSAAALLAYTYLSLSRWLVQGEVNLVDIPENLPGILIVSGGTTVVSMGITAARGPKAAGPIHPSFSDLLTVGGVVSPERFQFFLWTIVGVASFLFAVLQVDPLVLKELPAVPERLLYLSGASAAGYLGGKMVRAPGPIIENIIPTVESLKLTIIGRNLAASAGITLEGKPLFENMRQGQEKATTEVARLRPKVVEPEDNQDPEKPKLAKILELKTSVPPEWKKAWLEKPETQSGGIQLTLTLTNDDGQKATWPFEIPKKDLEKLTTEPPP